VSLDEGGDERSRSASVTEEGRRVLAKADPAWAVAQTGVVERFGVAQWSSLVAELQRLADCAARISSSPPAPGGSP
jgi:DNA-binding MarR family transcriptional regulator